MINFPIFDRISVQDYALYVGKPEAPGLHHDFRPGVNVIVGINGLGKTTLLNILLRVLTGPFDLPQGEELGEKKRRLVSADRHWFRRRVPDDAVNARVTATFSIGEHYFEVERSLANLDIVALSVDQQPVPLVRAQELEASYQRHVIEASGLSSFGDFVFLLRYIVFFLEDRRSLVWDAAAQGDILGILFGEQGDNRREYVELYNDLLSKDSEYRNVLAVVNKRKKEYAKQASTIEGGQIDMLIKQLDQCRKDIQVIGNRKANLAEERDSLRNKIENRRRDIHDHRASLATNLNDFYQSFFPQVDAAGRYLLSYFEAETGCLVCGSRTPEAIAKVNAKLVMNMCPICESPVEHPEQSANDPHAGEAIERQRAVIEQLESQLQSMFEPLIKAEEEYAQAAADLVGAVSNAGVLEQQLTALGRSVPNATKRRDEIQSYIMSFEATLNEIEVERIRLTEQFRGIAKMIDSEVKAVSTRIENSFKRFIGGFLAEDCTIAYTARQSRIGQRAASESFPFPHFIPALTSGVYRNSATPREYGQSVSESQKEFIDLAFRMALLEIVAPEASAMLILETPEASLDSVFVPRAADLLRRFAIRSGGGAATRLIASSNVNREQMIPALFGAYPDQRFHGQVMDEPLQSSPPTVPIAERANHVLDLLEIAAPTKALDRFRAPYEEERNRAIYPERFVGNAT
ncbi:AAA family ATPase [Nitrosospira briensis]|uniref:AAA family ATPase n=1 Tax=Nitrosospira briensis TaxID=35799 RepID=UPI000469B972|nr:AAA family ATPase [Nitrosospira briensis]